MNFSDLSTNRGARRKPALPIQRRLSGDEGASFPAIASTAYHGTTICTRSPGTGATLPSSLCKTMERFEAGIDDAPSR